MAVGEKVTKLGGEGVRAVVFDWNGTLNDMSQVAAQNIVVAKERFGVDLTEEQIKGYWGRPASELFPLMFQRPDADWRELWAVFWQYDDDPRFKRRLHSDVVPTLEALASAGVRMGIMTSGLGSKVAQYMDQAGLPVDMFEFIHTSDEIKSDVDANRPALTKAVAHFAGKGIAAEQILLVGDEPNDYANAAAAGVGFAAVRRPSSHIPMQKFIEGGVPLDSIHESLDGVLSLAGVNPPTLL